MVQKVHESALLPWLAAAVIEKQTESMVAEKGTTCWCVCSSVWDMKREILRVGFQEEMYSHDFRYVCCCALCYPHFNPSLPSALSAFIILFLIKSNTPRPCLFDILTTASLASFSYCRYVLRRAQRKEKQHFALLCDASAVGLSYRVWVSNSEGIRELFVLVNRELMELETHSHTRSHAYTHSTGGKKKSPWSVLKRS